MEKLKVGITIGDINGIGLEVILKTLVHKGIQKHCTPIIYGSSKAVAYHRNIVEIEEIQFQGIKSVDRLYRDRINVINCWQEAINITLGKPSAESGAFAYESLKRAVDDLKNGQIDALVTAPINKEAMQLANFPHPGHTEYITEQTGTKESLMLMVNDELRIGLVTNHHPVKEIAGSITKERISQKIQLLHHSLQVDFGIERPTIAVLALNPHAGDGGVIGDEEEKMIRPAVIEAKKSGILALGPYPADGFFGAGQYSKFDGILAMYHDQGLVPFKLLSFGKGVNFTAGLPVIRTSPDHGTAYEIAGKNEANPVSFRNALFLAIDIARNRKNYGDMRENALVKQARPVGEEEEEELNP